MNCINKICVADLKKSAKGAPKGAPKGGERGVIKGKRNDIGRKTATEGKEEKEIPINGVIEIAGTEWRGILVSLII